MRALICCGVVAFAFALSGCPGTSTSDSGTQTDSGQQSDAGNGTDAGVQDAGTGADAGGQDAGTDAGGQDAGTGTDAGGQDSGTGSDAGTDSGVQDSGVSFVPCASTDYVGGNSIAFGGALGIVYSPKCLVVDAGTMVTWNGDFSFHPLTPSTRGTQPNPIQATGTGTTASFTLSAPGYYPYYCHIHGADDGTGFGMDGVIQVLP